MTRVQAVYLAAAQEVLPAVHDNVQCVDPSRVKEALLVPQSPGRRLEPQGLAAHEQSRHRQGQGQRQGA